MFIGSVCQQVRDWFASNAELFEGRTVLSGCCGNFTIETVLSASQHRPGIIVSNDISLYTSALGAYFTNYRLGRLKAKSSEWCWLNDYLKSEKEKIHNYATVVSLMADYALKYMKMTENAGEVTQGHAQQSS